MKFVIRNQANISNKYIRFAKWKIRSLSKKFTDIFYSEIYIKRESTHPITYKVVVKLGVPGPDIILSAKSTNLNALWAELSAKIKRQLRKKSSITKVKHAS
jgi:ribosome-associated translation inhibitor RaiA